MSKQMECSLKWGQRVKAEKRSCVQDGLERLMECNPWEEDSRWVTVLLGDKCGEQRHRCTGEQKSRATGCEVGNSYT